MKPENLFAGRYVGRVAQKENEKKIRIGIVRKSEAGVATVDFLYELSIKPCSTPESEECSATELEAFPANLLPPTPSS